MKKLLILSVVLLLGIFSVTAQSSWEVLVEWDILVTSDCQFVDLQNDRFVVAITIEDIANNTIVVNNSINIEPNDVDNSTFDLQDVQDYCGQTHQNTPNFKLYTAVRMVNISSLTEYCFTKSTVSNLSCSDFSDGVYVYLQFD